MFSLAPSLMCANLLRLEHGVKELVAQRVYGLALGYEDLNDD